MREKIEDFIWMVGMTIYRLLVARKAYKENPEYFSRKNLETDA